MSSATYWTPQQSTLLYPEVIRMDVWRSKAYRIAVENVENEAAAEKATPWLTAPLARSCGILTFPNKWDAQQARTNVGPKWLIYLAINVTLELDVPGVKGLDIRNQHGQISLESQSLYT
jgi:hypothetical protein